MKRLGVREHAALASAILLLVAAVYAYRDRYAFMTAPLDAWFWDAKVFLAGGQILAAGGNPYATYVLRDPFPLPFVSPPAFAHLLGVTAAWCGPGLLDALVFGHLVSLIAVPLMLSRWFLGPGWTEAALGYGLLLGGFGAWGVTTLLAGNFGSTLYLLVFAGLGYQVATGQWLPFHLAVIAACQVKFPYALFWAIPVMVNGWDWHELLNCLIAAALATAPYALSALVEPGVFAIWMDRLARQVYAGDVGISVYGATWSRAVPTSCLPIVAHGVAMVGAFLLVLTDKTRGPMRLASIIVLVIAANPRMKEYDIAFATIPASALYLAVLAPANASDRLKALAIGVVLAMMVVLLKVDRAPLIGPYAYALGLIGALASLRFARKPPAVQPALA